MKRIIWILFIVVGIMLLSIPYLSNLIVKQKIKSTHILLDELTIEDLEKNRSTEAEYDYSSIRDVEVSSVIAAMNEPYHEAMIGQISIPDLKINLPILNGTTDANLMVGATTMLADQKMGEKNYPLAGHYMKDESLLFGNLLNIKENTIVKLTDKNTIYEYRIYETLLVPDTAMYMLEHKMAEERGKPIISLMTCYYTSKNGQRFFALGELIDEYPYNPKILNK